MPGKRKKKAAKRGNAAARPRRRSTAHEADKPPRAAASPGASPAAPAPAPPDPPGVITIRKYANRRLYDTHASAHITQEDLYRMVGRGAVVRIIDASTGEDITNQTLALALIEHDPGKLRLVPTFLLHQMIRLHEQALGGWLGPLWRMPAASGGGGGAWPGFGATWPAAAMTPWNAWLNPGGAAPSSPSAPAAEPDPGIAEIRREMDRLMRRLGELESEGRSRSRE